MARCISNSFLRRRLLVPHIRHMDAYHASAASCAMMARRTFSDNLLGHSPMAHSIPNNTRGTDNYIPTAKDVTTAGGVWAPTSAKRDKIIELKSELEPGQTLDSVATKSQTHDLWLVDGLDAIAAATDTAAVDSNDILSDMHEFLNQKIDIEKELHQIQWEDLLRDISKKAESSLSSLPPERYLRDVRDYIRVDALDDPPVEAIDGAPAMEDKFTHAVARFRLHLLKESATVLSSSWATLTTVSDQDIDRAAVSGEVLEKQAKTLPTNKMMACLEAYLKGSCQDRVDSVWALLDRDHDGLLTESEMNSVCNIVVQPVHQALKVLLDDTLEAWPPNMPPPTSDKDPMPVAGSWRQQRATRQAKNRLSKMLKTTLGRHFEDEVEMPHRLRCIYAWANKAHQENRIESVHVEESGWSGRQRYVELPPKIRLEEFREVQKEHFPHLDRVGSELLHSFREDLLVSQGKGRQNLELARDCALFLVGVSLIDLVIVSL